MPATVVVGGQYGSEGKGKVAREVAAATGARAVVRVGGSNSGHTAFTNGVRHVLRQLPVGALLPDALCVIAAGSYVRVDVLLREIAATGIDPKRVIIDEAATVISDDEVAAEASSSLKERIGSTCSGTGAAVLRRVARLDDKCLARECEALQPFLGDAADVLRTLLSDGERVVIEGTQGFGLSLLHGGHYPKATSRDTTAAAAVAEAGLSPMDVDDIVMVLRAFPIRVAGDSGPLPDEIDWATVAAEAGLSDDLAEFTSVTGKLRRVARFTPEIARRAIAVNQPTTIVLNHLDHVDAACEGTLTDRGQSFVDRVESSIGRQVDWVGTGPDRLVRCSPIVHGLAV